MPYDEGPRFSDDSPPRGWSTSGDRLTHLPPLRAARPGDGLSPPTDASGTARPEGYRVRVAAQGVVVAASDQAGLAYAEAHLQDLQRRGELRIGELTEWPSMPLRGVIEGFYGAPWTHAERLRLLREIGSWRMNRYVYAPKDDPHHRARWRDAYPPPEAERIAELATTARESGVRFVYALHPGLDMVFSSDPDNEALARRARELAQLGVTDFALLFDDIETDVHDAVVHHPDDQVAFGVGHAAAGRAHASVLARFATEVLPRLGLSSSSLLTVPTDYAGGQASAYREAFADGVPEGCTVMWTGADIVVARVDASDAAAASRAFHHHRLVLWDNFPVNDFDRSRAFLGPLPGRDPEIVHEGVVGILANPMVEHEPSRFALHTVAQWAWDPTRYDPESAARSARETVAGEDADLLAPLITAASSWAPSAPQHPELEKLALAAVADVRERERLASLLADLADCAELDESTELRKALAPWGHAAALTARVISTAVAVAHGEAEPNEVDDAWEHARTHPRAIARDVARRVAEAVVGHELPNPLPASAADLDAALADRRPADGLPSTQASSSHEAI